MKNKLEEVTEKICELLKFTKDDYRICVSDAGNSDFMFSTELKPIREADVLDALSRIKSHYNWAIWDYDYLENSDGDSGCCWHIGWCLSEQSEETITFLHEILGC
jgi:hypothetical protein